MAAAMARGWAGAEDAPDAMAFADAGSGRAAELAKEVGGEAVTGVRELAERSDVIVLAFKRTALDEVASQLSGDLPPLISVLAGVPQATVQARFPDTRVLRAMPNLAVEVRKGVICYVPAGTGLQDELEQTITGLLGYLGMLCPVDDELVDAATAIMSSSPAYLALISQALVDAAGRHGIDSALARSLVTATMSGTAELLRERQADWVRAGVASPGGATEAGLDALERRELGKALQEAVDASLDRMRP